MGASTVPMATFSDAALVEQHSLNRWPTNVDTLTQLTTGKTAASGVAQKPICKLILSGSQAVGTNGPTASVSWGQALVNTDNMWTSQNPTAVLINTPGWYRIRAQAYWATPTGTNTTSERVVQFLINGGIDPLNVSSTSSLHMSGTSSVLQQCVAMEHLAQNAALFVGVFQNTGASLNLLTNGNWGTWLTVAWEAPY